MKSLYFFSILVLVTISFVSCGEKKPAQDSSSSVKDTTTTEVVHEDYICPVDCEKGKLYHEMGKCPVCKMDLIKKVHTDHDGHDHHDGDGHDHKEGDGHDHKEGDGHEH